MHARYLPLGDFVGLSHIQEEQICVVQAGSRVPRRSRLKSFLSHEASI